ncbi:MAG: glycosyltransferase [Saprospiraceae bacterium]|nr:glycosyltransferase [Saprospiraceae bacterium]
MMKEQEKIALAKGIEQAKHQVLLLTDADCVPASPDWVQGMVAGMDEIPTSCWAWRLMTKLLVP